MARTKPGSTSRTRRTGRPTTAALATRGRAATVKAGATTFESAAPVKPTASSIPTETLSLNYDKIVWKYWP